ncbi:hypothetical protein QJS10_CPA06g01900 [Acorus calamus]|uniref:Uncharacterized protein n=1 Tax=Acorus calamus TaxID=4465 RepID=A0AAV9ELS3_ACOCL|nr:hypothetical protein QJS10_CPA06g01900 [Acorus calamus]
MGDEERILYTEGVQKRRKRNRAVGTFASDDQQLESTNDGRRMQRTNYLLMAQMNSYFHQASQPKRRDQRKKYIKSFLTKLPRRTSSENHFEERKKGVSEPNTL